MADMKMQDMKLQDHVAGHENAGRDLGGHELVGRVDYKRFVTGFGLLWANCVACLFSQFAQQTMNRETDRRYYIYTVFSYAVIIW